MITENKVFRRHALLYAAVENAVKNASEPMTANDLLLLPAVNQYDLNGHSIHDAMQSLRDRKLVRRVPAPPKKGDRCRHALEWIRKAAPKIEQAGTAGFLDKTESAAAVAETTKPEVIITSKSVVVITNKIRITVEYGDAA